MKAGARALGFAESYGGGDVDSGRSVLCGALVRADRVVDDVVFGSCRVGGTDATAELCSLVAAMDRPDARYVLVSGIAPAWFNVLGLREIHDAVERPVLSVSFESSPGLEPALREHFSGEDLQTRLDTYQSQPPRTQLSVNGETVFVRAVGVGDDRAAELVRGFTPEGGRPEPLRVARIAARAARQWMMDS